MSLSIVATVRDNYYCAHPLPRRTVHRTVMSCPSVCLHVLETKWPNFTKRYECCLWRAQSSYSNIAMRYVLPVLGMTSRHHRTGPVVRCVYSYAATACSKNYVHRLQSNSVQRQRSASTHGGLRNVGEVCYLRLPS